MFLLCYLVFFFVKIYKIIIKLKREKDIFDFNYNFVCFLGLNCTWILVSIIVEILQIG